MQPGDMITPGQQPATPPEQPEQSLPPQVVSPVVEPPPAVQVPQTPAVPAQQVPEPSPEQPAWQFTTENSQAPQDSFQLPQNNPSQDISWTASEYVSHDKTVSWFALAGLVVVAIAGIIYLVTREWISAVVVGVLGIAFAAFAARPPGVLDYALNNQGVHIGSHVYPYGMFRSFSVLQEGGVQSILLVPLQRFGLPITIYYDPADEERIIEVLGGHLPHENRNPSPIDNLMRKIRF